jgi:hypothetical protein
VVRDPAQIDPRRLAVLLAKAEDRVLDCLIIELPGRVDSTRE